MKFAVILSLILASTLAMNIMSVETDTTVSKDEATISLSQSQNNLQISNYTGSGITPEMVSNFIKVINDAYTFYKDNLTENAKYIQNKL
jgi:hypothetical protein